MEIKGNRKEIILWDLQMKHQVSFNVIIKKRYLSNFLNFMQT